jgi:hypothetical protein
VGTRLLEPGLCSPWMGQCLRWSFPGPRGASVSLFPGSKGPRRGCQPMITPAPHTLHRQALHTAPAALYPSRVSENSCQKASLRGTQEGSSPHSPGTMSASGHLGLGCVLSACVGLGSGSLLPGHVRWAMSSMLHGAEVSGFPILSIVWPTALTILPIQVFGSPCTLAAIPNPGRQWDLRALGLGLGACYTEHPERGRCVLVGEPHE